MMMVVPISTKCWSVTSISSSLVSFQYFALGNERFCLEVRVYLVLYLTYIGDLFCDLEPEMAEWVIILEAAGEWFELNDSLGQLP